MKERDDCQLNISFAEKYDIKSKDYLYTSINDLPFSVRVVNCLMSNDVTTLYALLESSPQSLMELKGFGKNCLKEVENFCAQINNIKIDISSEGEKGLTKITVFRPFVESIVLGDFSFADKLDLSDEENKILCQFKEAFNVLGDEFAFDCVVSPDKVFPIISMLNFFQNKMRRHYEIRRLLENLPEKRKRNKALPYIFAFTSSDAERRILQGLCRSENTTIMEMVITANLENNTYYLLFKRFLEWCSFDLHAEISGLFKKLYKTERNRLVIEGRSSKRTLEQIGIELGVTRERIRQIEVKVKKKFAHCCSQIRIISKISAERNGDQVLTPLEIEEYCGEYAQELIFLLRSYESTNYTYDQQLDIFVIGNESIQDQVNQYVETLPNIIRVDKFSQILKTASEDTDIPSEMFEKAFLNSYRLTGNLYHRYRLSLASIYEKILEKYYPEGLKIYDPDEIEKFRQHTIMEYGNIELPQNDRALAARIASICILCGKGIYKLKQKKYMPKDLADRIYKYIVDGDSPIFLTNTLYSVFEEELIKVGITNKYYLQGVLRELFSEEFIFRRDYISKDANVTSVYSSIVEFIKRFQYPVSKALVQKEFPGITEIVINFAVSDSNILNYFGEYLHASNLKLLEVEKNYLQSMLNGLLSDGQAHHSKDIYEIINREKPEILKRNSVLYQYSAYSILEYLFKDIYQFSRPYIAQKGVDIGRPAERLHDLIYSSDKFEISEISEFAKENRYQIQSILDFINGCNDEYLLINSSTIMKISCIGITNEVAEIIENLVVDKVICTMPIYELTMWNEFPQINVPWTEWLLYSVLNKWSNKVSVSTSSSQFRMAVPLISPVGSIETVVFADIDTRRQDNSIQIDDLDDIDVLLEDIIDDSILEEKYEL